MKTDDTKITVAHLVMSMDRIEQWLQAVRKGLEALPQDQEINIDVGELQSQTDVKQPFIIPPC